MHMKLMDQLKPRKVKIFQEWATKNEHWLKKSLNNVKPA